MSGEDAQSEEECALVGAHGLTREQIAFRRRLQRQFGVLARQEYPESADDCFLASGELRVRHGGDRRAAARGAARRWSGAGRARWRYG